MSNDDHSLLEAFNRQRDESSFRRLYRRHTPMIFALAVRLSGSRAQAEELTQEAWVRAIENQDRFQGQSKYSTWLAGILVNCSREAARKQRRTESPMEEAQEPVRSLTLAPRPTSRDSAGEAIDIERALAGLPPGYREVVILHDVNGHTHQEIAEMLEIQPGTSKSQLKRGRERLRELLTNKSTSANDRQLRGTP